MKTILEISFADVKGLGAFTSDTESLTFHRIIDMDCFVPIGTPVGIVSGLEGNVSYNWLGVGKRDTINGQPTAGFGLKHDFNDVNILVGEVGLSEVSPWEDLKKMMQEGGWQHGPNSVISLT